VGVGAGDVAAAQAELSARFGPHVCAVRVPSTVAEQRAAFDAVKHLYDDPGTGVYTFGQGFATVQVDITVLDDTRYAMLAAIGFDRLSVDVWLTPVRASGA
jgi:hypothetical protein